LTGWDALLFDFDGVLADTEPIHYACWKEILEPFGIQLDWGFYQKQCIGISDRLMIRTLAAERIPPVPFEEIWPEYDRKQIMFRERLESNPPFLEETIELIRSLSSQYKLAVVSSSGRSEVEPPIELAGFRSCFHTFVCGREVPNLKPAPDPYLKAAELVGATRPLVIEDSDAGIISAQAAGFEVVRVTSAASMAAEVRSALQRGSRPRRGRSLSPTI
jgi:beta-phosphoglucomutase